MVVLMIQCPRARVRKCLRVLRHMGSYALAHWLFVYTSSVTQFRYTEPARGLTDTTPRVWPTMSWYAPYKPPPSSPGLMKFEATNTGWLVCTTDPFVPRSPFSSSCTTALPNAVRQLPGYGISVLIGAGSTRTAARFLPQMRENESAAPAVAKFARCSPMMTC